MSEGQGATRTNISLPRELKARMDAVKVAVNWSQVAATAFEAKLLELESKKETKDMDDVIARLKAAEELESKEDYRIGFEAGERWAKKRATPKQLLRLSEYIDNSQGVEWWDVDCPGWNAPWGAPGYFALAVLGLTDDRGDRDDTDRFWEDALGDDAKRVWDADFFRGFGEGAADVWYRVKDKL